MWGCIAVDRSGGGASVIEQLRDRVKHPEKTAVVVFPEGTTSSGHQLLLFKRGAFVPGAPVKPAIIRYPYEHFNPAWESMTAPAHLFRLLTQFVNYCEVELLPVYTPSEAERNDPALYAQNVRAYMSKHSGLPMRDVDLSDKQEYLQIIRGSKKLD